jgi:hypothetical protein
MVFFDTIVRSNRDDDGVSAASIKVRSPPVGLGPMTLEAHHDVWAIAARIQYDAHGFLWSDRRPPTLVRTNEDSKIE